MALLIPSVMLWCGCTSVVKTVALVAPGSSGGTAARTAGAGSVSVSSLSCEYVFADVLIAM